MDISHTSTRHLKQQNILFTLLFLSIIGLLAFLSNRYIYLADWTVNSQNSLNEISLKLLETLEAPVEIVSYTNSNQIKQSVRELVKRYQRIKPDMTLTFINPNTDPETIRSLNITVDGEMVVRYAGRQENLSQLSEQDLSSTLHRLLRAHERKIFFTQGHGERSPEREANFDLNSFSSHLTKQGFLVNTLNLAKEKVIPDDTSILVIAGPQAAFLPGEVRLIIDYVNTGGNLIWLGEPLKVTSNQPMHGLLPLAELLGIEFLDGVVVDPTTQQYDISRPDYAIVSEYPPHPVHDGFATVTLFPQAAGIERLPGFLDKNPDNDDSNPEQTSNPEFNMTAFLTTIEQSWIETSPLKDKVHYSDLLDIVGPITIGMALSRQLNNTETANTVTKEQRIVILGDGDFLSNTFLGNAGNLSLGINIFNWLSHDEQFINIPTRTKNDIILDLSPAKLSLLGTFFLFIIPGLLVLSGSLIWFKRRNR
ncbi:MAG: GldG family protein [gamma proteobacterium symbiont of Bathyaustriella thionipta]|nr:GldG family protein [gamma proteobacterium symbiont of Bathyaustriella thionipta]MCU7948940.1 GldG family protein [gamma proteobacterium symbiont of Bathyaustriella thionipta]MCU7953785.1 GldG family protein [gamma proteobacterium symbiont of Bathyaustriella thionipta]MCU7955459.1 GldG family protein [gamma proteobacterium symbiont of Bathyaustriella thionipta]MCU7966412.1 GldG family protein [gamma proteobacterium symbiont of Bathyaustriella thionipta]